MQLGKIKAAKRNVKAHDIELLIGLFQRFGFMDFPTLNEKTGRLAEGHGRKEALLEMQARELEPPANVVLRDDDWAVPVVRGLSWKNDAEAEAYLLAHNQSTIASGWDDVALAQTVERLQKVPQFDFTGLGFSQKDLDAMVQQVRVSTTQSKTVIEKAAGFANAAIKQIVLYWEGEKYDQMVDLMDRAMLKAGLESRSELIEMLLARYMK